MDNIVIKFDTSLTAWTGLLLPSTSSPSLLNQSSLRSRARALDSTDPASDTCQLIIIDRLTNPTAKLLPQLVVIFPTQSLPAVMSNWQLWLSPRPAKRSNTADSKTIEAPHGSILYEFLEFEKDGELVQGVRETHVIVHDSVRKGKSGPPLHIHLEQSEYFEVLSGTLGLTLNGEPVTLTKEGGRVSIPPGARHTFWVHESSTEDCSFIVWVKPQHVKNGLDEGFLRNFAGYLSDCDRDGLRPSVFQLLVFLWDANIVLTPPFWMPLVILKGLHQVLATYVGQYLLGYKTTYPEYHNSAKKTI
ncbi:hypothetical protein P389DRAFT_207207 [Cystobasidium minutum MCA 4210]|uniref:uncharacterized protein n=1 Tax=Cystobasidium minutum MCA 4210 TaxID=1397322 RepID=UPI0034CFB9A7|eukprot:jgi/Rhomi1/207207/estExt_Genemark1.C_1_t10074